MPSLHLPPLYAGRRVKAVPSPSAVLPPSVPTLELTPELRDQMQDILIDAWRAKEGDPRSIELFHHLPPQLQEEVAELSGIAQTLETKPQADYIGDRLISLSVSSLQDPSLVMLWMHLSASLRQAMQAMDEIHQYQSLETDSGAAKKYLNFILTNYVYNNVTEICQALKDLDMRLNQGSSRAQRLPLAPLVQIGSPASEEELSYEHVSQPPPQFQPPAFMRHDGTLAYVPAQLADNRPRKRLSRKSCFRIC